MADTVQLIGVAGSILSLLLSGFVAWSVAHVRAEVADLRADIAERQERRCAECREKVFVSRHEWNHFIRGFENG